MSDGPQKCIVCRTLIDRGQAQFFGDGYGYHAGCEGVFNDIAKVVEAQIVERIQGKAPKPAAVKMRDTEHHKEN